MAINSHRHTGSARGRSARRACFITPHFSIRLRRHTHLSPSSVSGSITVISSGNMAIVCFIKCQIEARSLQATCLCAPLTYKTQHTPDASEGCNNRETRFPLCTCKATSGRERKKKHLPLCCKHSHHPSSVRKKPLADWVVPLSGMKKLLAVPLDCEMGYYSRAFLANAKRRLLGNAWDSKHHNWSGQSVSWDRNTYERGSHAQSVSKIPPLLVCSHLTSCSCSLLTTCHVRCPLVFTAASCCIHWQQTQAVSL